MGERLKTTFQRLNIDYEIVLVNDKSPDDSVKKFLFCLSCTTRANVATPSAALQTASRSSPHPTSIRPRWTQVP